MTRSFPRLSCLSVLAATAVILSLPVDTSADAVPLAAYVSPNVLSTGWTGTQTDGFFSTYCILPDVAHQVTIQLSDDTLQVFDMNIFPSCQAAFPIQFVDFGFSPTAGALGSLSDLLTPQPLYVNGTFPGPLELLDLDTFLPYQPTVMRYVLGAVSYDLPVRTGTPTAPVPEPTSLLLLSTGLAGLFLRGRTARKTQARTKT